jgi:exodeoxyribonuclease-3
MLPDADLSICSWNVNSLKVRFEQLKALLQTQRWDVICLQETKMTDDRFPYEALRELGYHAFHTGQPTYNGVAILARLERFQDMKLIQSQLPELDDPQQRFILAQIDDLVIACAYVPNGQAVDSDKFKYKLNWLDKLYGFLSNSNLCRHPFALLGDFNIAPQDIDVHDAELWRNQVLCTSEERIRFQGLLDLGLTDCFRHLEPLSRVYSWWDYRQLAFQKNKGLRIDHILISQSLVPLLTSCEIVRQVRKAEKASDHAPVLARLGRRITNDHPLT